METAPEKELQSNKIKKLPPSVVKDIELKNQARRLASLALSEFESDVALLAINHLSLRATELVAATREARVTLPGVRLFDLAPPSSRLNLENNE